MTFRGLFHFLRSKFGRFSRLQFRNSQSGLVIEKPRRIKNPERISIGDDVWLGPGCWLMPITRYPTKKMSRDGDAGCAQAFDPQIVIGNNVTATANLQIFAQVRVTVEDDVMFASNVFINDGSHGYQDGAKAYRYQPIFNLHPVRIGRGCWVGQNVVIMPGVSIGAFSIIGANSVVTHDIPSGCIAAGSPAVVKKRWSQSRNEWVRENRGPGKSAE